MRTTLLTSLLVALLPALASARPAAGGLSFQLGGDEANSVKTTRVPVILGVMSKCPDAELCESVWDHVLDSVGGLVDIELVYIGSHNSSATHGVTCMHGDDECAGNIQQLCAAQAWPGDSGDLKPWADWWNFVQCQNYGPRARIGNDDVAKRCARIVGHSWDDEVERCANGKTGNKLLQKSVARTKELNIAKSCTIIINRKKVCIHDGTWKNCQNGHSVGDFAEQVKQEWKKLNGM